MCNWRRVYYLGTCYFHFLCMVMICYDLWYFSLSWIKWIWSGFLSSSSEKWCEEIEWGVVFQESLSKRNRKRFLYIKNSLLNSKESQKNKSIIFAFLGNNRIQLHELRPLKLVEIYFIRFPLWLSIFWKGQLVSLYMWSFICPIFDCKSPSLIRIICMFSKWNKKTATTTRSIHMQYCR